MLLHAMTDQQCMILAGSLMP